VIGIRIAGELAHGSGLLHASAFAVAGLLLFAAIGSLRDALRVREVDSEHLCAALSAYLLAGLFFGVLAGTLEATGPGSYVGSGVEGAGLPVGPGAAFAAFARPPPWKRTSPSAAPYPTAGSVIGTGTGRTPVRMASQPLTSNAPSWGP
jgi:hypothetical protein